MSTFPASGILLEAEDFDDYGGWVLDSQFEMEMGSPYLLAHGNGKPVADATTKDWVPGYHPGRFKVIIDDEELEPEFGANDHDWSWQFGGIVELPPGDVKFTLRDLTGFCGRCDAIFLTLDDVCMLMGTELPNSPQICPSLWCYAIAPCYFIDLRHTLILLPITLR